MNYRMPKVKTFSELVYKKHIAHDVIARRIEPRSDFATLVRCSLRNKYLFATRKNALPAMTSKPLVSVKSIDAKRNYLMKMTKKERRLVKEILEGTLLKAYAHYDAIRLVDFMLRLSRTPTFDPTVPLSKQAESQLVNLNRFKRVLVSNKLKKEEQKIPPLHKLALPYLEISDAKSNLKYALRDLQQTIDFMTNFTRAFPELLDKPMLSHIIRQFEVITKQLTKFEDTTHNTISKSYIDAFYYLMKIFFEKRKGKSTEEAKGDIEKIQEILEMKPLSPETFTRKFSKGKNYINTNKELKKILAKI